MESSVIALEKLLEENQQKINNCRIQLGKIQSELITVSPLKKASIENTLEQSTKDFEIYKKILDSIPQKEKDKQKELSNVQEALKKQTYYKLQKIRIKRSLNLNRNQKLEAMMIVDELPHNVHFDDKELLEIGDIILKNNIRDVIDIDKKLQEITIEFNNKKDKIEEEQDLKHFAFLDSYIPIIVLHFSYLIQDINNNIQEHNENETDENKKLKFRGLPKFEDWWIEELFVNHQAYFGLYKWKSIIENLCLTKQEKIIWNKIFNNWLMIKKILNSKEENSFYYNFLFDDLIRSYAGLEEELDDNNLKSMEKIINSIIKKENFLKFKNHHNINTIYSKWKLSILNKNKK